MKKIATLFAVAVLLISVGAHAQTPARTPATVTAANSTQADPAVAQAQADWQAYLIQQQHVMGSLNAVFEELAADQKHIAELEAENAKLRAAMKPLAKAPAPK